MSVSVAGWGRTCWRTVIGVALCLGVCANASASSLPADAEIKVLLTALAYEKTLPERCKDGLRVGVVSLAGSGGSKARAEQLIAGIKEVSSATIRGLTISPIGVEVASGAALASAIQTHRLNVLYLGPELSEHMSGILGAAKGGKLLTITGEEAYVKVGAVLGVGLRADKPKIIVNLEAAKAVGADFDFRLLRLAEVIQ